MTYEDFDDEDFEQDSSKLVKDLRNQLKAEKKRATDLEQRLASAEKATRTSSLKDVLASMGAKPALAKYYPSDGEVTKEAVTAWLDEDGELFGYKPGEKADPPESKETTTTEQAPPQDPAVQAELAALSRTSQTAQTSAPPADMGSQLEQIKGMPIEDLLSKIGLR